MAHFLKKNILFDLSRMKHFIDLEPMSFSNCKPAAHSNHSCCYGVANAHGPSPL